MNHLQRKEWSRSRDEAWDEREREKESDRKDRERERDNEVQSVKQRERCKHAECNVEINGQKCKDKHSKRRKREITEPWR